MRWHLKKTNCDFLSVPSLDKTQCPSALSAVTRTGFHTWRSIVYTTVCSHVIKHTLYQHLHMCRDGRCTSLTGKFCCISCQARVVAASKILVLHVSSAHKMMVPYYETWCFYITREDGWFIKAGWIWIVTWENSARIFLTFLQLGKPMMKFTNMAPLLVAPILWR